MWFQKATELQSILGWEEAVLVSQIGDFVKEYPTHRIVVVDLALKSSQMADWKGVDYIANEEEKIVFLHYYAITFFVIGKKIPHDLGKVVK